VGGDWAVAVVKALDDSPLRVSLKRKFHAGEMTARRRDTLLQLKSVIKMPGFGFMNDVIRLKSGIGPIIMIMIDWRNPLLPELMNYLEAGFYRIPSFLSDFQEMLIKLKEIAPNVPIAKLETLNNFAYSVVWSNDPDFRNSADNPWAITLPHFPLENLLDAARLMVPTYLLVYKLHSISQS
jgi:hypothetical protein